MSVSAVTMDAGAEAGADYRPTSETVSWGDGETGARTVEFELTVTDTETDIVELYGNPLGEPADVVRDTRDTRAFPVCDL